jgi:hypothetical protein
VRVNGPCLVRLQIVLPHRRRSEQFAIGALQANVTHYFLASGTTRLNVPLPEGSAGMRSNLRVIGYASSASGASATRSLSIRTLPSAAS